MALGKHPTYVDQFYRSFQEEVAGALDNKDHQLVECGAADNSVRIITAVGNAIGVMFQKLQPGTGRKDDINVRLFGGATLRAIQNAAIAYGARVMEDSTSLGRLKAVPATTGTYISRGRKVSQGGGAAGDHIEITNCPETVVVP